MLGRSYILHRFGRVMTVELAGVSRLRPREFPMKTYSLLAAAAAIAGASAPAAAQSSYPYPQAQPQVHPQPGYSYGQQGYSQDQSAQNPIAQVIDSLLG